jgi:hypothetical protein
MDVKSVKSTLNKHVKLKDSNADYLFTAYIFRKGKSGFIHQAELQDVKSNNSIVIAKLEDVEPAKGSA